MNQSTTIFVFILMLLLTSCNLFKENDDRTPIARVNDEFLYADDVENVLSEGVSKNDSTILVNNFINRWAAQELLMHGASINLSEEKLQDFNQLVEQYRKDLVSKAYMEALVMKNIDTIVSLKEAEEFYKANRENFKLNEELIKFRYIHVDENISDLKDIKKRFKNFDEEDKAVLDSISIQFRNYSLNDSIWVRVNQVINKIPSVTVQNKNQLLKKSNFIQLKDSLGLYLMQIEKVLLRNEIAPLQYIKPTIDQIVINKRKLELVKQLEKDITKDAIENKKFEIYNNMKLVILCVVTLFITNTTNAQETIKDTSEVAEVSVDTIKNPFKPIKVDGVAAVVGDFVVLDSDIDKEYAQLKAAGVSTEGIPRCQLFGKLLEDKLYVHHAIQDSIEVSDIEIRSRIDQQVAAFLEQTNGDMDKLLRLYNKEDEKSLKDEMFELNKNGRLASLMQENIVQDIEITPEEVRQFFNSIPKDSLPVFGTELKVAQIIIEPKVSDKAKQDAIDRLQKLREDIINGSSFATKVILNSDDEASKPNGGKYTLNRKRPQMVKEFRDVAFSLQEGEISQPFETEFGYHIIQLDEIKGQDYVVRHILIIPEVTEKDVNDAKEKIIKVRDAIVDGSITFAEAAKESSDEKETKFEGGKLINPETQDYSFELTKMDPELYGHIEKLKDDEVTQPIAERGRTGDIKFKILTVTDRFDRHTADYAKDYLKIKQLAENNKSFKAIGKWQDEKIMDTYIKINGEHRKCTFSSNWLKQ